MSLRQRWSNATSSITRELQHNNGTNLPFDLRTTAVLLTASVLLTLFYYYGRPPFFRANLEVEFVSALGLDAHPLRGLLPYGYWALASLALRVLIPLLCIWFWFREHAADYGFRRWLPGHGRIYLALYLLMLPVLVAVSFTESFQGKYPFYDQASESLTHFLLFELAYGTQFIALEAFFRGFLLFALFKRLGYHAVTVMTVPYCMIHFGKPPAESLGAIIAGVVLGYLALQSRSWLPGAMLHFGVGLTLDLLCILHDVARASSP